METYFRINQAIVYTKVRTIKTELPRKNERIQLKICGRARLNQAKKKINIEAEIQGEKKDKKISQHYIKRLNWIEIKLIKFTK